MTRRRLTRLGTSRLAVLIMMAGSLALATRVSSAQPVVPEGYRVTAWRVEGLSGTVSLALDSDGRLYAAQTTGEILLLDDADHDGKADPGPPQVFKDGLSGGRGMLWHDGILYVTDHDRLLALEDRDGDDRAEVETVLISGLPTGAHGLNGICLGSDGKLTMALGSTCDLCDEADPRSAAILRCNLDGSGLEIFATGVRNAYDLAYDSAGDLFAADNGFNGGATPDYPPDELNRIVAGGDYGWPDHVGEPPPGSGTIGPIALFPAHSSPDGILFYDGLSFPGFRGAALVALWGAWDGTPDLQKVARLDIDADGSGGYSVTQTDFATGMLHPLDLVAGETGDLFVADFGNPPTFSAIYRIEFEDLAAGGDLRPGGTVRFTMRGQGGDRILLFGSLAVDYLPLGERGVLRLDPASLYRILAGTLPGTGKVEIDIPIPNDPALVGLTFHHQLVRLFGGTFFAGVRASVTVGP